jgi:phosphate transport system ATP-binding protein
MDEPASALDPIATGAIEDLMKNLASRYTIVIVTHNMQQATRVSDRTAFFSVLDNPDSDTRAGTLIEYGPTEQIFADPRDSRTQACVTAASANPPRPPSTSAPKDLGKFVQHGSFAR